MTTPAEAERFIRFQLEQLSVRNEHHAFEDICVRAAKRRVSSNIRLSTGPVGGGGDQGRDGESYHTRLPEELPGAGGFVGAASTVPVVVACTAQKSGIEAKIRADLRSIAAGEPVERVAYFTVSDVSTAIQHNLQRQARETHGIGLDVFDGQTLAVLLAEPDLVWVAERYLGLPSHMVPDVPASESHPEWYAATLAVLRERAEPRLTPGAFSEIRDGLRRATFHDEARPDLPEWLDYMRAFIDGSADVALALRAHYECAIATLRGRDTMEEVEADFRTVLDAAADTDDLALLDDATVLLGYWGGAWLRNLGAVTADELRERGLALRTRVAALLSSTHPVTHPMRAARLEAVAAYLCLHVRWTDVSREDVNEPLDPDGQQSLRSAPEDEGLLVVHPDTPIDTAEAMGHLDRLADLLPKAPLFPVASIGRLFQMMAPALASDARYPRVRDALDAAIAAVSGDSAAAARCRDRAMAFRRAGRPLDALAEMHQAKIRWFAGDTLRGSLLAMRLIASLYSELRLPHAAKQYALTVAWNAAASDDTGLHDLIPEALIDAMDAAYVAGAWHDAAALARMAILAHANLAENALDLEAHPSLTRVDFDMSMVHLVAEKFRPSVLPVVQEALGDTGYEDDLRDVIDAVRASFRHDEQEFVALVDEQLVGRPFSDLGRERVLGFAALGSSWRITSVNNRPTVLAAERLAAAAQILLVELAPGDPVLLPQDVNIEVVVGTRLASQSPVRIKPNNYAVDCTVVLTAHTDGTAPDVFNPELAATLIELLSRLSARPQDEFMHTVEAALRNGLLHKLHIGRPYDEMAGLLDTHHYDRAVATDTEPLGEVHRPKPAPDLAFPSTPGPGYDRAASLRDIREQYELLPTLIPRTLPLALRSAAQTLTELRSHGWLDWHLLLALTNTSLNVRLQARGLLNPYTARKVQIEIGHTPEAPHDPPVPPAALTADALRKTLDFALLSVAKRRWGLLSPTQTPNIRAFENLLAARYGLLDDVPHRDLLTEAFDADGKLRSLVDVEPTE